MTSDGTAAVEKDYSKLNEIVTMKANESEREIAVTIVDDDNWEPDKDFYVSLK